MKARQKLSDYATAARRLLAFHVGMKNSLKTGLR
jgi:hypothetical protein